MEQNTTSCFRCVGGTKTCTICRIKVIRHGYTKSGVIRYRCRGCGKTQVENYTYKAYFQDMNQNIINLTKEGMGIRSTARFLQISTTTLLKRILLIAKNIKPPVIPMGKEYEVDELCTYVGNKEKKAWVVCAMQKQNRDIVNFNIGRRTNQTLKKVTETLHLSHAKKIFTDKLRNYKSLIEEKIHKVVRYGTNHLERFHLTLRTHLKRLNRKTICFSRSLIILTAVLKIYLWG